MNRRRFLTALAGALVLPVVPLDSAGWPTRSRPSGYKWKSTRTLDPDDAWRWYSHSFKVSLEEALKQFPCKTDPRCECEFRLAMGEQVVTCRAIEEKRTEPWEDWLTWKLHA